MAIDSALKRKQSCRVALYNLGLLPIPDGTVEAIDRAFLADSYFEGSAGDLTTRYDRQASARIATRNFGIFPLPSNDIDATDRAVVGFNFYGGALPPPFTVTTQLGKAWLGVSFTATPNS